MLMLHSCLVVGQVSYQPIDTCASFSCCRLLALDEADRMVDGGFEEDVSGLIWGLCYVLWGIHVEARRLCPNVVCNGRFLLL